MSGAAVPAVVSDKSNSALPAAMCATAAAYSEARARCEGAQQSCIHPETSPRDSAKARNKISNTVSVSRDNVEHSKRREIKKSL